MNISDYNPIRQRFYMIFKSLHMTQAEFGKRLGKSQKTISAILNNKQAVTGDMIQLLRYKFNVNPDYLLYGRSPMFIEKMGLDRKIPIIADIPAGPVDHWYDAYSAGAGEDYISAPDLKGTNLFAIRVKGNSMEPTLYEGDILVIAPHNTFTYGIGVVRHREGFTIKKVIDHGDGRYTLRPHNPEYPEENITADNETHVYIPIKVISLRDL